MVQLVELALDLGSKSNCVVSFSKTLYLLHCTGSTYEDSKSSRYDRKIVDWNGKDQH